MSAFNPSSHTVQCLESTNSVSMANPYLFNGISYGDFNFIGMGLGTYTFTGVTSSHPIGFDINDNSKFEVVSGTPFGSPVSSNQWGSTSLSNSVQHYIGTIVVNVKGDFGQISYHCYRHGYMGGQNRLVYHEPCSVETPTLTQTPILIETPTLTQTPTLTETQTETETETETQSEVYTSTETIQPAPEDPPIIQLAFTPEPVNEIYEVFTTNDKLTLWSEVKKYLIECGDSEFSITIKNVEVLSIENENVTFGVTYDCDQSKDVSPNKYCIYYFEVLCSGINNPTIDTGHFCFPESMLPYQVAPHEILSNFWLYNSQRHSLSYIKNAGLCIDPAKCHPDFIDSSILSEPSLSYSDISKCPNFTPTETPSESITPSESETETPFDIALYIDFIENVHMAGDLPHFPDETCYAASSEVLVKPNGDDLDYRSFYKLTENGFFYEYYGTLEKSLPTDANFKLDFNGESIFFLEENEEEKTYINKGFPFINYYQYHLFNVAASIADTPTDTPSPTFFYHPHHHLTSFVSLVDISQTPTSTIFEHPNLVKDVSLFKKTFGNFINTENPVLSLDFDYWFSELPSLVYNNAQWFNTINDSAHFPSFKIIQNVGDFSTFSHSFSNGSTDSFSSFGKAGSFSELDSYVFINEYPSDFSPSSLLNRFLDFNSIDPVFNVRHYPVSNFCEVIIEYSFNFDQSQAELNFNSLFPQGIKRREKIKVYSGPNNSSQFPNNYATDCTLGIVNPKFKLIQGNAICLEIDAIE